RGVSRDPAAIAPLDRADAVGRFTASGNRTAAPLDRVDAVPIGRHIEARRRDVRYIGQRRNVGERRHAAAGERCIGARAAGPARDGACGAELAEWDRSGTAHLRYLSVARLSEALTAIKKR